MPNAASAPNASRTRIRIRVNTRLSDRSIAVNPGRRA
jgi:hypothetical protein